MRTKVTAMVIGIPLLAAGCVQTARTIPVSKDEATDWVRYTVPLPKQIEITGQRVVSASQIMVLLSGSTEPLAVQAVRELREAVSAQESAREGGARFTILLQWKVRAPPS